MLPRGLTMATQQSSMATQQSSVDAQQSSVAARRPNPPNFFLQRFKECDPIDSHDITRQKGRRGHLQICCVWPLSCPPRIVPLRVSGASLFSTQSIIV